VRTIKASETCRTIDGCRDTAESDFSYLRSSYLLEYINHAHFEEERVLRFHGNAHYLKQVIAECIIPMFKHQQLLSSMHIFVYYM